MVTFDRGGGQFVGPGDLFAQSEDWGITLRAEHIRGGVAYWANPVDFPVAQVVGQLLFALLLALRSLSGELRRFWGSFARRSPWMLLPSGIQASVALLVFAQAGFDSLDGSCSPKSYAPTAALLMPLLVAPIAEELIFRGWAIDWLRRSLSERAVLFWTASVFTAMHWENFAMVSPFWGAMTAFSSFAIGVALGLVRLRTGSIIMCIAAHALVNLLVVALKIC